MRDGEIRQPGSHREPAAAFAHGIARVGREVEQDLLELIGVRQDLRRRRSRIDRQLHGGRQARPDQAGGLGEHLGRLDRPALRLMAAAEGEEAFHQIARPPRGTQDGFVELLGRAIVGIGQQRQLGVADDRRQEVVELVGHSAGQRADRLPLLRLQELALKLQPVELGLAPGGDVVRRADDADHLAGGVAEGKDARLHEDARAVLAEILALVAKFAAVRGGAHAQPRVGPHLLGGHPLPEGAPEHLLGRPAVELGRAAAPVGDDALEVGADDRLLDARQHLGVAVEDLLLAVAIGQIHRDAQQARRPRVPVPAVDSPGGEHPVPAAFPPPDAVLAAPPAVRAGQAGFPGGAHARQIVRMDGRLPGGSGRRLVIRRPGLELPQARREPSAGPTPDPIPTRLGIRARPRNRKSAGGRESLRGW